MNPPQGNDQSQSDIDPGSRQKEIYAAASALEDLLARVPTTFGKLAWISKSRIVDSDEYQYPNLTASSPADVTSHVLRSRHLSLFSEWLEMSLEEQHNDLTEYFDVLRQIENPSAMLFETRAGLMPYSVSKAARLLFLSKLDVVLTPLEK